MELIQLDIDKILKTRISTRHKWLIPRPVTRLLERIIHQDELNRLLREAYPAEGSAFASKILEILDIKVIVKGLEKLDDTKRYVFASNHPLGGLDGITLIAILGGKYGDEKIKFLVNDLLMNVVPLRSVFLPINKYGAQGREATVAINEAYASDSQILIFPAGLVSRKGKEGIRDLKWNKAFVSKAVEYGRDIVPVHFKALNRSRFYNLAYWRKKLGVKVNIEQATLPAELCNAAHSRFEIVFGKPIPYSRLESTEKSASRIAAEIRDQIYTLD
ncbi:MAG: 1-acyl-sn-glycerol-3-phosphate acyltransferase [Prevotella sp.]|nr:1-acyl-sn-glycerol-3-phosphate acyltransferase [Bacteroides sp.]MCM1366495.1 1-acyl-sn-glycerol-3-phosphate acyltransferase [Prevotella sp.]MCM1436834.1 1-acyl-sn-glycerol-3-phosphate acyltransferase [Prevotella sp.]